MNITADTRLIDLTAGQLGFLIKDILTEKVEIIKQRDIELLNGVSELAEFLGWSYSKTQVKVASGFFEEAMFKNGRNYNFDKAKVLEVLKVKPRRKPKAIRR